jgi:hypothetical protein
MVGGTPFGMGFNLWIDISLRRSGGKDFFEIYLPRRDFAEQAGSRPGQNAVIKCREKPMHP